MVTNEPENDRRLRFFNGFFPVGSHPRFPGNFPLGQRDLRARIRLAVSFARGPNNKLASSTCQSNLWKPTFEGISQCGSK